MRRDFLVTAFGIAGGQAIVLMATPILARIYTPADFGVYAAVMVAASVIATVASVRFEVAIPAVATEDVRPLFRLAIVLPFFICSAAVLLVMAISQFSELAASFFGNVPLWSVWLVAMLQGMVAVTLALCTRTGSFGQSAAIRVLQPIGFATTGMAKGVGLNGALALGWLVALIAGLHASRSALRSFNWKESIGAAQRSWKYPVLSVPVALLDTLAVALPIVFIVAAYGSSDAGSYSQVQRLMGAPLVLSGMAVAQVFYKHAGDRFRARQSIAPIMWRVVAGLLFVALALLALTVAVGEGLMGLLLGTGWRTDTGFIVLSLAPVLSRMVVSPVSSVFLVVERLGILAFWQVTYFIVTLVVLTAAKDCLDLEGFLLVFACNEFFMYGLYLALAAVVVRTGRESQAV